MRLPEELQQAIASKVGAFNVRELKAACLALSDDYRHGKTSRGAFREEAQLASYLVARMPATFAACRMVFQEIRARLPHFICRSFLDLGAGPGSSSWAALDVFSELSQIFLIEREINAIEMGRRLSENSLFSAWKQALWRREHLDAPFEIPPADFAVLSYSYGELEPDSARSLIGRLWDQEIPLVAVIEPGTPKGFERIRSVREFVLQKGAHAIAPCSHAFACPMTGSDWCHFAARIERDRLHRQLKEGTLGYEDEKFSYFVYAHPKKNIYTPPILGRIVRAPHKGSGFVRLPLCAKEGLRQEVVTRSARERYRSARDAEWGSAWM